MGLHDQEHDFNEEDIFDEGKGAGGVGGDDYDSDDEFDEDDELLGFTYDDDGDADFDTSGRAPDECPYGDLED
ncbi:hypothetical protein ACK36G_18605 [Aeromonas veronii]|uniref:hypothetical protein n=1 Tax=Aeromonas TaxID=642 RepID=UPI002E7B92C8|nr:hypothetical protein [Aeromonas caviae]MEE1913640.1 hypothetical protein [Aeromonas caviae]